jgi:O-antigen ligase
MKITSPPEKGRFASRGLGKGIILVLALMPFHALLTVWAASIFGGYAAIRLWKEYLLFVFCLLGVNLLLKKPRLREQFFASRLVRLLLAFLAVTIVWTVAGLVSGGVSGRAAAFGFIVDARLPVWFLVVYIWTLHETGGRNGARVDWRLVALIPAAVVIGFALAQYLLPADFLRHFGYGPDTIPAYQAVDNKIEYVRLQSTTRGPNPLGAYLVVIIPLALAAIVSMLDPKKRDQFKEYWPYALLAVVGLNALFGSYSRSAWLGAFVAISVVIYVSAARRERRFFLVAAAALVVIASAGIVLNRDNDTVQNLFFHTDEHSAAAVSTNFDRAASLNNGWRDVVTHPLGHGVGSAGPASHHNRPRPARIAENHYLQIGQETGWLGMGLFVAILAALLRALYRRRADPLALGLLGALAGLALVNFFSHAWTDDTLAYVFWGLAALAVATNTPKYRQRQKDTAAPKYRQRQAAKATTAPKYQAGISGSKALE